MPKNAVTDWATNEALNTDIGATNIAEGCAPSGINDAIRKVMAQFATWLATPTFASGLTGTTASFSGAITQGGNQVWHAGNLTPGNYAALAGATFTGSVSGPAFTAFASGTGRIVMINGGGGSFYGQMSFQQSTGVQDATIGGNGYGTALAFVCSNGFAFTGAAAFSSTLSVAGAITQAGNQVWHAGNLTPGNYAALAGAAFTGAVSVAGAISRDANFSLDLVSSKPRVTFDSGDYLEYDRTANKLTVYIASTAVLSVDSSGNLIAKGNVTAAGTP